MISLPFDRLEGEPYAITVISRTGLRHEKEIEVATATPTPDARSLAIFGLLGVYVGVIPVFLGLLWLPFPRAMPRAWLESWLAVAMGLPTFLGIDTLRESLEILERVPSIGAIRGRPLGHDALGDDRNPDRAAQFGRGARHPLALVREAVRIRDLVLLGVIGGAPTIVGTWNGAFT